MARNMQTVVRILGERPTMRPPPNSLPISPKAAIYNSSRPVIGTRVDDMSLTWQGDPVAGGGTYYAAVEPDDPDGYNWRVGNRAQGAVLIEYVTIEQVREAVEAFDMLVDLTGPDEAEVEVGLTGYSDEFVWQKYVDSGLNIEHVHVE
jgi:hypothetical protein